MFIEVYLFIYFLVYILMYVCNACRFRCLKNTRTSSWPRRCSACLVHFNPLSWRWWLRGTSPNGSLVWILASLPSSTRLVVAFILVHAWVVCNINSSWKILKLCSLNYSSRTQMMQAFLGTGALMYLQAWCAEMKGAVFVAMWSPLALIFTIICSSLFLGEAVHLGR